MNPALSILNAYEVWTNSLQIRITEVINAYHHVNMVAAEDSARGTLRDDQPPGSNYDIAARRLHAALTALPFWLRWIFA